MNLRLLKSVTHAVQCALLCTLALLTNNAVGQPLLPDTVTRIAFGSCAKERNPQPIWTQIAATQPDLFLFIGDNQYADLQLQDGEQLMRAVQHPERFTEAYNTLGNIAEFARFKQSVPILATWDDHDYGANDAGAEYPLKRQSQQAFLDFFGFAETDPIREQAGIYQRYTFGIPNQRVQVILLDTRFHRDPIDKNTAPDSIGRYLPTDDTSRSMLGPAQWQWLEQALREPADVRILVSSIQVVAYQHGWESWGTMPHERQRLYDLIRKTKANGVVMLSGDRHLMEISVDRGQLGAKSASPPYPIWDFTASGLTDAFRQVDEHNSFRVGLPYSGAHFGMLNIDWGESLTDTQIQLLAHDHNGDVITRQSIDLKDLQVE